MYTIGVLHLMKILLINKYYYRKAGAEVVFIDSAKLLSDKGHEISFFSMHHKNNLQSSYDQYFISNVDYEDHSLKNIIKSSGRILYSFEAARCVKKLIKAERPDIVHMHNIYHQISPSILSVLKEAGIPMLMTLHDYKPVCACYSLLNNSKICEKCSNGRYFNCFIKKCVKNSWVKSLLCTIEMYLHHNFFHYYDLVDCYISPSQFLKNKVLDMGFSGRIAVLPNFITLDDFIPQYSWKEKSIVYFGRLAETKGVLTLIEAAARLKVELKIIGDGPIRDKLQSMVKNYKINNVNFLGYKSGSELKNEIANSMAVVVPSEWYENYPMSIIEAFALGKPVIGSRIGGIPELITDYETGITFETGNTNELQEKINWLIDNPDEILRMGRNARYFVEDQLSSEKHYQGLMKLYNQLIKQ